VKVLPRGGEVYCVWDRDIPGWSRTGKCRPCLVLARTGSGDVRVVPRTTHPRDKVRAIPSALRLPAFDKAGWFVHISVLIAESDLLDHRGSCEAAEFAAVRAGVR
jgi:hypothetical protein